MSRIPIDVHLMVRPVDALAAAFADAGADIISFHPEATDHVDRTLQVIHDKGCKAGLVLNPATPLAWLDHTLQDLDVVLLMSVNPGLRRPGLHPVGPAQDPQRARADRFAPRRRRARHLARGRRRRQGRTTSPRSPLPAPTPSSPVPPCSARPMRMAATAASCSHCGRRSTQLPLGGTPGGRNQKASAAR